MKSVADLTYEECAEIVNALKSEDGFIPNHSRAGMFDVCPYKFHEVEERYSQLKDERQRAEHDYRQWIKDDYNQRKLTANNKIIAEIMRVGQEKLVKHLTAAEHRRREHRTALREQQRRARTLKEHEKYVKANAKGKGSRAVKTECEEKIKQFDVEINDLEKQCKYETGIISLYYKWNKDITSTGTIHGFSVNPSKNELSMLQRFFAFTASV